ncbi:MAG TPA: hypothetical protein VN856_18770 [Mycobacterium sp.]|nr:hypothetical protein [Mycobacterium sp.]
MGLGYLETQFGDEAPDDNFGCVAQFFKVDPDGRRAGQRVVACRDESRGRRRPLLLVRQPAQPIQRRHHLRKRSVDDDRDNGAPGVLDDVYREAQAGVLRAGNASSTAGSSAMVVGPTA